MAQKTTVHGHPVAYEENAAEGIRHLRDDLDAIETRVYFDQAHSKGSAEFEDDEDRQFTLIYQNGSYVMVRR